MTATDLKVLREFLAVCQWQDDTIVTLHSPSTEQEEAFLNQYECEVIGQSNWNVMTAATRNYDVLFFANVFMYVNHPEEAFKNVLNACRYVLIQDIIYRDRSGKGLEYCNDGDCMRYTYKDEKARIAGAYDLSYLQPLYFHAYDDEGVDARHFIMLLMGNVV